MEKFDYNQINCKQDELKRFKQIQGLIGRNQYILDIGCAKGEIMAYLRDFNNNIIGLDIDEKSVKLCLSRGLKAYCCDIEKEDIPAEFGLFDVVLMAEVLEHLIDPLMVLRNKVYPLLKFGGSLVISTPNLAYIKHRLNLFFGRMPDFGEDQSGLQEKRPYNLFHKSFFSKNSIVETLKLAGFEIKKIEPTQGVISNRMLKFPIFKVLRNLFSSLWAGSFTILAIKK